MFTADGNGLITVRKIRRKPCECFAGDADCVQSAEQAFVIHRVKRYGETYEDELDHLVVTQGTDDVVLYPKHGGLSAMIHAVC